MCRLQRRPTSIASSASYGSPDVNHFAYLVADSEGSIGDSSCRSRSMKLTPDLTANSTVNSGARSGWTPTTCTFDRRGSSAKTRNSKARALSASRNRDSSATHRMTTIWSGCLMRSRVRRSAWVCSRMVRPPEHLCRPRVADDQRVQSADVEVLIDFDRCLPFRKVLSRTAKVPGGRRIELGRPEWQDVEGVGGHQCYRQLVPRPATECGPGARAPAQIHPLVSARVGAGCGMPSPVVCWEACGNRVLKPLLNDVLVGPGRTRGMRYELEPWRAAERRGRGRVGEYESVEVLVMPS